MLMLAGFFGTAVMFCGFRFVYQTTLRTATGWEDPDTKEFEQKKID